MSPKKREKHLRHPFRKRILKAVLSIFLALLFLEFIVYFGSNLLLNNWARQTINEATSEVYQIDFNRINISLIRRGVFLDGIVMKPNERVEGSDNQTLFDFSLDQLALKGSWYSVTENNFYLGKLEFDNPNIKLDLGKTDSITSEIQSEEEQISAVKSLEQEIRKSIEKTKLNALIIREVEINNADLFFFNFLSNNSLKVENSRLTVRDINWTSKEDWTTPFNARGFEFDLENGQYLLPDGVHTVSATKVFVSSLDNLIDIEGFNIRADKSRESKFYYQLSLDKLILNSVDLNRAFTTSDLFVEEIVLNYPRFDIAHSESSETTEGVGSSDLNELIEGVLKSVQVKELSINQGKFISADVLDTLRNRISIGDLDFKMIQFYLGEDDSRKQDQFFYGKDASMEILDADIYLSDEVHRIQGDRVSVSSFKDGILVENFRINPREGYSSELQPNTLIRIDLPQLTLSDAHLKKWYNEGKFDIDELVIDNPKVEIISNTVRAKTNKGPAKGVEELLEGYFQEMKVNKFDLNNGEMLFTNATGVRSDDIGFEKFSLFLENVLINPLETMESRELFLAEEMVLELDDYRLKLKDNLHEFSAQKILIDSKNELVQIKGFIIQPEDPGQISSNLTTYGKSGVIDLNIPLFRAEGIDIRRAFFDEELRIKFINIPSSSISLKQYDSKKNKESGSSSLSSSTDLEELLTAYFNSIEIDSLSFRQGKLAYENNSGDKSISISEENLDINLKNFRVDRGVSERSSQTFFSDEIDLEFKDYSFSLAGGNYRAFTEDVRYNSKEEKISIENLRLEPTSTLESKIKLRILFPKVTLLGADIDAFLFDNILDLQKLEVVGSNINLEINPEIERKSRSESSNRQRTAQLPKSIDLIKIDSIEANQSNLDVNYLFGESDQQSIQTKFDLLVKGFNLDSISSRDENISELFDEVKISLQDFSFALPDSVHTLKFSDVVLNTTTDESTFTDFEIVPRDYKGQVGKPVIKAYIKSIGLKNNKLASIIQSGQFNVTQLSLTHPEMEVYLDKKEDRVKSTNSKNSTDRSNKGLINSIVLDDLLMIDGKVKFFNKELEPLPKLDFEGINLSLNELTLELMRSNQAIGLDYFLEKNPSLSLKNYSIYTKDSLNKISIGKVNYLDQQLHLEEVKFQPILGRYDYLRKKIYQSDAIEAKAESIQLDGIQLKEFLEQQKLSADRVLLDGLEMNVLRDKRLPLEEGILKSMPQALMQHAPFEMQIDSIQIRNGFVRYQEFSPRSMLPGSIYFSDLNMDLTPFILVKEGADYPIESSRLHVSSKLMGEGDVLLDAELFYADPFPMNVAIEMGELDLRSLNNMLSRGVFVKVLEGRVTDGKWNFTMDNEKAIGTMDFHYEDLKIELLDTLTLERGKGKLNFMSFLGNLVAKNSNPRKFFKKEKTSDIYFQRDKSKFIFGGWWKATLSGLKGSLGLGQAKMPKRKEEE